MTSVRLPAPLRLGAAALLLAACEHPASPPDAADPPVLASESPAATLLQCTAAEESSVTVTLGTLGGTVVLGDHMLVVPQDALPGPTTLEVVQPASTWVELRVHADGKEHYQFLLPVTITLGYGRCDGDALGSAALRAWHVDEDSRALLEDMGGLDDRLTRTVTFTTGHLSGYAVAQ